MGTFVWTLLFIMTISQVSSQPWQNFRNGRPMFNNRNSFRQSAIQNPWQRNLNIARNIFNNEPEADDIMDFDDPTVGLIDHLDRFFFEDDPDDADIESQIRDSMRAGRANANDLSDVAFNAKTEQELLFGDAFKDIEEITGNIVTIPSIPNEQNTLADQIRRRVQQRVQQRQRQTQRRNTGTRPRPTLRTPNNQSQNPRRNIPRPFGNQQPLRGNDVRNISITQESQAFPYLLLVNSTVIENAKNNVHQRRTLFRGGNTEVQSEQTQSVRRSRGNQHITNSDMRVSRQNSSNTFSSLNDLPNDMEIDNALNLALSAMQLTEGIQANGQTDSDISRQIQSLINARGLRNMDNVRPSTIQREANRPNTNRLPNRLQIHTQITDIPNVINNGVVMPALHVNRRQINNVNSQRFRNIPTSNTQQHMNRVNSQRFRNQNAFLPDTPGLTRQQQIAQQASVDQRALAQRIVSQRFPQDHFAQSIRQMLVNRQPTTWRTRPFPLNLPGLQGGAPLFNIPFPRHFLL